MGLEPKKR